MVDTNLVRGFVLMAIALLFGSAAYRYPIGDLSRAGPGMFPLIVSGILFVLAAITAIQSRVIPAVPMDFKVKNIVLVLGSLVLFVLSSMFISMFLGIALLVFVSALAGTTYSLKRNIVLTICLIGIALAFEKLLGLNLGLL